MNELELELKELIIEALFLDSVKADDIDSAAPLFDTGLGLDSIDALELSLAIERRYGVKLRHDDNDIKRIFASVHNLAAHIDQHRSEVRPA